MTLLSFSNPLALYLLLPVALLIAAGFLLKSFLSRRFEGFFEGGSLLALNLSSRKAWLKGAILSLAIPGMVAASAGPVLKSRSHSYNLMALVDISQSMWCQDYRGEGTPRSRLDVAKENLLSLLAALPAEGRLGLAVFAGKSSPVLVLTPPQRVGEAQDELKAMIESIGYSWTWDDGTDIEATIYQVIMILNEKREDYGAALTLILLTDGENAPDYGTAKPSFQPEKLNGVRFYFAGLGTIEGAQVPEFDENWNFKQYQKSFDASPLVSRLDEEKLKGLAQLLHGTYLHIDGSSELKSLTQGRPSHGGEFESEMSVSWAFWLASFLLVSLYLII